MAKDPVLVIFQLTGGNDYLNTIIPLQEPTYRDFRKLVVIPEGQEVPLDDNYGFHPEMAPLKPFWDDGKMALIHGIGYENSPRSHFRSMDIWHTCEPNKVGTEGWVGRTLKVIDPDKENVLTGVNFGQGLPRAMAMPGVPVASVSDIENYGVLTGITGEEQRARALDRFARLYSPAIGTGAVMEYLGQTGLDALKGADILKTAPEKYSSNVEYAATPIAQKLRGISMVHQANLGTRIFYTQHASFDTHASQMPAHQQLWKECSRAVADFFADLRENDAAENVVLIMFSEFGRRVRDNGSGTDHGAGGVAFAIGDSVNGGHFSEYPSMKLEDLQEGDLAPNYDFRGFYSTLLEKHMGLDPTEIVGGTFEQLDFIAK
jgi:uncharacterized protein (DUF1501 family)